MHFKTTEEVYYFVVDFHRNDVTFLKRCASPPELGNIRFCTAISISRLPLQSRSVNTNTNINIASDIASQYQYQYYWYWMFVNIQYQDSTMWQFNINTNINIQKMARQYQYQYQYWINVFTKSISISIVPILAIILTIAIFYTIFLPLWRHCYLKGTDFTTTFMKICHLMFDQSNHFVRVNINIQYQYW